ncbi:unnamed protein product [Paramecium sonneborni]|uniref:Transmembrane protein n=1 Tax=Paramecium sonneborni TaxID=65129 RepID=A0A8S1RFN4_9CILI|nr:unnamed protein product [Paramecium sonneborni]
MKITQSLFFAILFANVYADVLIKLPYQCSCSQLITKYDCYNGQGCIWNEYNGTCQPQPCVSLNSYDCAHDKNCMWSYTKNQCDTFQFCNQLQANGSSSCFDLSINCPYQSTSGVCGGIDKLEPCSAQTNSSDCYSKISQTRCFFDNKASKCIPVECSQMPNMYNCTYFDYCHWNQNNGTCAQLNCNNTQHASSCQYVYIYSTNQFQTCVWNVTSETCNPADNANQLIQNNCTINTVGSYRWNPNTNTCQSCYAKIITIILLQLILIFV